MKVNDYNQFVRGRLFVLVDSLNTFENKKLPSLKDEANVILELSRAVIKLVCKWLNLFPEYLQYYVESGQAQNLYLVSLKHAVAASLPELTEMLKLIFGMIVRGTEKFASLSRELKAKQGIYASSENLFQKACVELFNKEKGFELVIEAITKTGNQCPISVITELLDPLIGILNVQKDEAVKSCINEIFKKLVIRFSSLNDKDIKEISRSSIQKLFSILESLTPSKTFLAFGKDSIETIKEDMLKTLFTIGVQLINTPYIQKRLLGITMVKGMIPKQRHFSNSSEWKDPLQLIKVMEDKKLLEIILGENAHPEIIRKAEDIFLLYLSHKKLEKKHIELLWKCVNEKYEDVMRACLDLLISLLKKMEIPLVQEVFKFVETANYQNEILLKFLETYTLTILNHFGGPKLEGVEYSTKRTDRPKLYNLDLFWKLILDPNIQGKLKDQAMNDLVKILEKYTAMLSDHVYKSAELIKDRKVTIRGIQFLKSTEFATYYTEKQGRKTTIYNIEELVAKYSLIDSILKDCEEYYLEVKKKVKTLVGKSIMDTDFGSGFTFNHQARLYVDFLLHLCGNSELTLSEEEFLKLWKCYIEERLCEEHSDILFEAMQVEAKNRQKKFVLLNDKVARVVFDELLCNPVSIPYLNSCGFLCFNKYMKWIYLKESTNIQAPGLKGNQGFRTLWTILFQAKSEQLKKQVKEFLVIFIDDMCQKNRGKRKEFTETALEFALDNVKHVEDVEQTKIALEIINAIINKIEMTGYESIGPEYMYPPLITFMISHNSKESPIPVKINEDMKVSNLRCLLSNKYEINKAKLVIKNCSGTFIYTDEKDFPLMSLKRTTDNKLSLELKQSNFAENETPRYILANSPLFNRLKSLLCSPKEEIVEEVWNLISNLPLNEAANDRVNRLTFSDSSIKSWQQHLETNADYNSVSLVYHLYILSGKIREDGNKSYVDLFIKKGGVGFIFSVFLKKLAEPHKTLNLRSLEYCIRTISAYIVQEYETIFNKNENDKVFWDGVMKLIQWISNTKENKDHILEIIDMSSAFEACCNAHYLMLKKNTSFIENITSSEYIGTLKSCLLKNSNKQVQVNTRKLLEKILLEVFSTEHTKEKQKTVMSILLTDFLTTALSDCMNAEPYFDLVRTLIVLFI